MMHGLLLILALGLPSPDEDLADRVRALVEQLREDDIDAVDRAAAGLFRLGAPAIEHLRDEARRREGEVRLRIGEIIKGIERADRLRVAFGTPPLVSLKAEDRPLAEIMAELSKQSGIPVEGEELPEGLRASLEVNDVLVWEAVDRLCRGAEGLMFSFTPRRILLREGRYRALPYASSKGFVYMVDSLTWNKSFHNGVGRSYFNMQSAVLLPPGASPVSAHLEVEEFRDNQGTELAPRGGTGQWSSSGSRNRKDMLLVPLHHGTSQPPDEKATQIERFTGKVVLTFALRMNRLLSIEDPEGQSGRVTTAQDFTVLLKQVRRTGQTFRIDVEVTRRYTAFEARRRMYRSGNPDWRFVLRDDQDRPIDGRLQHRSSRSTSGPSGRTETRTVSVTFKLEEGAKPAALDLIRPEEFEELRLPFEFRSLPFGRVE